MWLPNATAVGNLRIEHWRQSLPSNASATATAAAAASGAAVLLDIQSPTLGAHAAGATIEAAIAAGASAVLVANRLAGSRAPTAINAPAPYSDAPWPVPVALVGADARAALLRRGARLRLLEVRGQFAAGAAHNLVAVLRSPAAPPPAPPSAEQASSPPPTLRLVVSTPLTGWFACGGERGPGIALWLLLARRLPSLLAALAARHHHDQGRMSDGGAGGTKPIAYEALLIGTTLHELGHRGAAHARALAPTLGFTPSGTALWVALGASIATVGGADGRGAFLAALDYNRAHLNASLIPLRAAGYDPTLNPPDRRGELLGISADGYAAFGFYGEHARFHTRGDGARSTSPALLAAVAAPLLAAVSDALDRSLSREASGPAARGVGGEQGVRGAMLVSSVAAAARPELWWTVAIPLAVLLSWRTERGRRALARRRLL